jgi:pre-rRNA-processing protein TSR3
LTPLEGRTGIQFCNYKPGFRYLAEGHTLLGMSGVELSPMDADRPLLLLDCNWRLLEKMESALDGQVIRRSLPSGIQTAYPRISKISEDPYGGLASVEALYIALKLMGQDNPSLLDDYYWKDEFLKKLHENKMQ